MLLCRLSYRPTSGPAGTRTRNPPINNRSSPLLHIAVPVRTVGIEPTTPGWKPGMFPLHHVHSRLNVIASRREESNLRRVDPTHACSRYTTSSRRDAVARRRVVAWHHCAVVKEQ